MVDGYDHKGDLVGSMADAQAELISMHAKLHSRDCSSNPHKVRNSTPPRSTIITSHRAQVVCVQPAVVAARVSSQLRVAPSAALPLLEGC